MQAQIALLADAANVSREGKLNIFGQFDTIYAAEVPMVWPMMTLVVKLVATAGEGPKHRLGVRVVDEDGNPAGPQLNAQAEFGKPLLRGLPYSANWILPIGNALFQKYGTVTFEILVDDHNVASIDLHIRPTADLPAGPQQS